MVSRLSAFAQRAEARHVPRAKPTRQDGMESWEGDHPREISPMETEGLAVTTRVARKNDGKLPRGIHRRGKSLVVSFALADGTIERRSLGPVSAGYAQEQLGIFKRQVREGTYQKRQPRPEPAKEIMCSDLWTAYKKNCETREVKRMHLVVVAGHSR